MSERMERPETVMAAEHNDVVGKAEPAPWHPCEFGVISPSKHVGSAPVTALPDGHCKHDTDTGRR
jgi:hypothetical protein